MRCSSQAEGGSGEPKTREVSHGTRAGMPKAGVPSVLERHAKRMISKNECGESGDEDFLAVPGVGGNGGRGRVRHSGGDLVLACQYSDYNTASFGEKKKRGWRWRVFLLKCLGGPPQRSLGWTTLETI